MAVNDKIKVSDYNNLRDTIVNILGTGSGSRGYGQPVQSEEIVSVSSKVTPNEWNRLLNDLKSIGRHQTGTTPSLPQSSTHDTIKFNNSTEPYDRYQIIANQYDTNRFTLGSLQFKTENKGSQSQNFTSPWRNRAQCVVTIQFSSHDQARYFFNSGGLVRISSSRSGGTLSGGGSTINAQNRSWTDFLEAVGDVDFGGATPGTGESPDNGLNFYRLTSAYTGAYSSPNDSSPYGANEWELYARYNGSGLLEIRSYWNDDHVPIGRATVDGVDGTLSIFVSTIEATGNLFPSGSLTVESPTVTYSAITAS